MVSDLLINIDVPNPDRGVDFFVVELGGLPVRLHLLETPSGSNGAADALRRCGRGGAVRRHEHLRAHAGLLKKDAWIIDGFGCVPSAWERFSKADTLVSIDLPLVTYNSWVTRRLIEGLFATPGGGGPRAARCEAAR